MKKQIFIALFLGFSAICSAQVFLGGMVISHSKATGVIYFKDGTSREFTTIELPQASEKKITAYDNKKQKEKFDSKDIRAMEVWSTAAPESHWILQYLDCNYPGIKSLWGVLTAVGEHAAAYEAANTYSVDKKGRIVYTLDSGTQTTLILHEMDSDKWLIVNTHLLNKKKTAEFFEKDPKISTKILDGALKFKDYPYIIENYLPE